MSPLLLDHLSVNESGPTEAPGILVELALPPDPVTGGLHSVVGMIADPQAAVRALGRENPY